MRALFVCAALLAGCDAGDLGCRVDVECGSGQVCVAGGCVDRAAPGPGDTAADGGAPDLAQPTSAPDGFSPDAFSCPFNGDGVLQRAELPAMPGLGGFFMAAPAHTTVNLIKTAGVWDFSGPKAGDEKVFDGLTSPAGTWWAVAFPDASYAQLLDAGTGLIGVYKIDDTHLYLLGAVSASDGISRTQLTYAPPIDVLHFPLSLGASWSVTANLSGVVSGIAFFATETWAMSVDDRGQAKTPAASFDALRLRIDYEQVYGLAVTRHVSYLFLSECYGVVTRIRSADGVTAADFTDASEYRRLAAP
jgi:hypothetical protein